MLDRLSLDGKTVVITGGGTGLGREMTLAMARAGADLVIASRRSGPIEETAGLVRDDRPPGPRGGHRRDRLRAGRPPVHDLPG